MVLLGEKLSLKYLLITLCLFNLVLSQCEGDMNGDGIMNVVDLVASVNLILAGTFECEEESVHGCLDSQACNYDPSALIDNNSCYYCFNDDCDTYPESEYDCEGNCTDVDEDDICDNVDACIGGEFFGTFPTIYHCGDLQVLMDIIDVNESLEEVDSTEELLNLMFHYWNEDGRLRKLNFGWSGLTIIPESIGNLSDLTELYLNANQLTSIPTSIGDLSNLRELYLHDNQIATLPESIGNLSNLIELRLYLNQLTNLPISICNLPDDCLIEVYSNYLCEEYHYDCIDYWGTQDQSNCCEGVNDDGETVPNWTTCP